MLILLGLLSMYRYSPLQWPVAICGP